MERSPRSINERRVFIDTSAFLAHLDRKDGAHDEAGIVVDRLVKGRYRLFTTMHVIVETHAALIRAMNASVARHFLVTTLDGISLFRTSTEDEEQAKALILQRTDKDYSFCDAISFTVMEKLGLYLAFAYDNHFRQHGFSTPLDRKDWP